MWSKLCLITLLSLSGCDALKVYTIDLPQGNPITQADANKLKLGMSPAQVRYILGSPMVTDTFNANRWDYVYRLRAGTYAKAANINDINTPHLKLLFKEGKLSEITGIDTLPTQNPATILSKDTGLRAEPL
ncbi:MAG TPA: outer membrane protein assembly factor BamE [Agitococcus sp.]|nr:outer membrane protein assembly factor BamE [Agitococcus sp.]